jgi:hypothetical protein
MMSLPALTPSSSPLLDWLFGSVVLYTLATNGLWLALAVSRRLPDRLSPVRLTRFLAAVWPLLYQAGRLLFFLGIPYLVLGGWPRPALQGLLSMQDMGFAGLGGVWPVDRWLDAAGTGAGLGLLALLLLLVAWANANHPAEGLRLRFPPRAWWSVLLDVVYLEVHWAFYRAALAIALDDLYLAVWLSVGLVFVEWALNPFWRRGWRLAERAAAQWLHAALAVVIAFLFLLTRNLWVCLVVHGVIELVCWRIGREPEKEAFAV